MKKRSISELYFKQKSTSVYEMVLIIIACVSAFALTFLDGGLPIGLPIFIVSIALLITSKSLKIKDDEIDSLLTKILQENNLSCSSNTLSGYEYKNTIVKKRKDGKIISPIYYLTEVNLESNTGCSFCVNIINLIDSSLKKNEYNDIAIADISIVDEEIHTSCGKAKSSYILLGNNVVCPVSLSDYNSEQLVNSIFHIA